LRVTVQHLFSKILVVAGPEKKRCRIQREDAGMQNRNVFANPRKTTGASFIL
jgi:hypothetical protein